MGQQKSAGAAYALWLFGFLGFPGFHRIYLNETAGGVTQLVLGILGWIGLVVIVGLLCLIPVYIWWFIDLFLIPGLANRALGGAVVIVR
jgi:TM2 domain-containing membrane protein YozV